MNTPLLLIHFNRPDITARQLEVLRPVAPSRVFVLCDAARPGKPGEAERVDEVRQLLQHLPWQAEVQYLFREKNLGCFRNLSTGISWFLEQAGEGIILEDDCLPHPSFFPYCTELLERYRTQKSVLSISGHNHGTSTKCFDGSYSFSNYFHCWGWATWQRAWAEFDPDLTAWRDRNQWKNICQRIHPKFRARVYWNWIFNRVTSEKCDSWAYRFQLTHWSCGGISAIPSTTLISNTGFDSHATNTAGKSYLSGTVSSIGFPLLHPENVAANRKIDAHFEDHLFSKTLIRRLHILTNRVRSS